MAGPSDKARFYLEHSVEDLNELERKKIFTREEIGSIAKKRSGFEHVINARGSLPAEYVRYIDFEKNVEALRRKRVKRLGVRAQGSGQRTIFFLYNRATKKFAGDLGLWMQYIDFARKEKAYKKLNDIFTAVVRLHPTKPGLWIYAAQYFMDTQADITNARSYMQRGLRFCKSSETLWLEYAKLETLYIGKIAGRRKILGLDIDRKKEDASDDFGADTVALPAITGEDVNPTLGKEDGVDQVALQNLASAPVLTGAIPIAIFESAMKQFHGDPELAERFFEMFAEFDQVPCIKRILQTVLDFLKKKAPGTIHTTACQFQLCLFGTHPTSPEFPRALRDALELLNAALEQAPQNKAHLLQFAIRQILSLIKGPGEDAVVKFVEALKKQGRAEDATRLAQLSVKQRPESKQFRQLQLSMET
ncbi:U3 small nucleolar RNA-associated protein 6-domain-containing protein [Clohesyomyces aquaticus]|uniref:U3 small nucleolar RNA-associated protein 6-domain-containing protein n=1 Tax=Clohesyomyces aquaticus TaxID=1231657 RepID=A0A1Y1Z7E3_9PLEO|nr:U3 small nucleolar RNA-associated protein 6-domain-containing protein [Clohesyomyces aquaticus]